MTAELRGGSFKPTEAQRRRITAAFRQAVELSNLLLEDGYPESDVVNAFATHLGSLLMRHYQAPDNLAAARTVVHGLIDKAMTWSAPQGKRT